MKQMKNNTFQNGKKLQWPNMTIQKERITKKIEASKIRRISLFRQKEKMQKTNRKQKKNQLEIKTKNLKRTMKKRKKQLDIKTKNRKRTRKKRRKQLKNRKKSEDVQINKERDRKKLLRIKDSHKKYKGLNTSHL